MLSVKNTLSIKKLGKHFSFLSPHQRKGLVFVLIFGLIGVTLLLITHALSPSGSLEPEQGSINGAIVGSDNSASNGHYVQFGSLNFTADAPIDTKYLTEIPFGSRSHWIQPWRAYLDTPPASALPNALGAEIGGLPLNQYDDVAHLLSDNGFTHTRLDVAWVNVDPTNQDQLLASSVNQLTPAYHAFKKYNLRPLVLLHAYSGSANFKTKVTVTAKKGDTQLKLDPAVTPSFVVGKSGLDGDFVGEYLFTNIAADGTVTLSQPLAADISGTQQVVTWDYEPFYAPNSTNPRALIHFNATMAGWLRYTKTAVNFVRGIMGNDNFDVEVWNELSFDSQYLSIDSYYCATNPNCVPPDPVIRGRSTNDEILKQTVAYFKDPANGMTDINIGDGFSNQTPFVSGATTPVGLTAIDKHTYPKRHQFPVDYPSQNSDNFTHAQPIGPFGTVDGTKDSGGLWHDNFTPSYATNFPEYGLTAIQTETQIRDIASFVNYIYGNPYGRLTGPTGGQYWVTETNLLPLIDFPNMFPNNGFNPAAIPRYLAKGKLRALVSFVNKGFNVVDFFKGAASSTSSNSDQDYSIASKDFMQQVANNPSAYPGANAGGVIVDSLRRLLGTTKSSESITQSRKLTLNQVGDYTNQVQFAGDGTAAHPPLYNRDVLGFFPFQMNDHRFVAGVYVMTRDMEKSYGGSDPITQYDLPAQTFRLQIGGFKACPTTVNSYDPLDDTTQTVKVVSCSLPNLTIEMPVTDSPRMLTIDETN